jgi:hypothetical protein
MTTTPRRDLTPAECLRKLPDPALDISGEPAGEQLRRVELRRSVLTIAELNHVSETKLVRAVVESTRDEAPDSEE